MTLFSKAAPLDITCRIWDLLIRWDCLNTLWEWGNVEIVRLWECLNTLCDFGNIESVRLSHTLWEWGNIELVILWECQPTLWDFGNIETVRVSQHSLRVGKYWVGEIFLVLTHYVLLSGTAKISSSELPSACSASTRSSCWRRPTSCCSPSSSPSCPRTWTARPSSPGSMGSPWARFTMLRDGLDRRKMFSTSELFGAVSDRDLLKSVIIFVKRTHLFFSSKA